MTPMEIISLFKTSVSCQDCRNSLLFTPLYNFNQSESLKNALRVLEILCFQSNGIERKQVNLNFEYG